MNNNLTKNHIQILRDNYEKACQQFVDTLLNIWNLDASDGWWVGEDVGEAYAHGDGICMSMKEIIYCVENNVSIETYFEFIEYITKCDEYNFDTPSLKSYCEGAPRVPKESFDKLDAMKKQLNDCIEKEKSQF